MSGSIPEAARALLTSEPRIAFLGTARDGYPHVAPLWYVVHDDHVEIATIGRKLANLQSNPRVAIAVQQDANGRPEWGVAMQGTARTVPAESGGEEIVRRINRRYGADEEAWMENTAVRIEPATVTHWSY